MAFKLVFCDCRRDVGQVGCSSLYGSQVNGKGYPVPGGAEWGPDMPARDEYALSVGDLLRIIRRRLWIIVVVVAVLTGLVVGSSFAQTPMYEASITILVGQQRGTNDYPITPYDLQALTQTMVNGVATRPVAKAVIRQENLQITPEQLLAGLNVEQIENTQFIQATYTDPSPERAQQVANALGDVFSKQVNEVSPSATAISATVWERAVVPDEPVTPNPVRSGLLALVLGLMLGVGVAFLLEYLDDSWHSPEEMEQVSGAPTFGIIPGYKGSKPQKGASAAQSPLKTKLREAGREAETDELGERLVTALDPTSPAAEAYRTLRTNLLYAFVDEPPKAIVLTSPGPGEGKSTTCANLGVVLAQAAKNTLILDCDFRKPVMHRFFGLRNLYGIVDVIVGERRLQDVWTEPVEGLHVVTVGRVPPNPSELLGTRRVSELLASFREAFDYVLVDAPPVGLVSDPAILATQGDGVLLVSDAQNTRKGSVRQSMRSLEAVGSRILGTVMNNVKVSSSEYYYYNYAYGQRSK
jgi:capsular exopolysaccharide synthesis family protein